LHDLIHILNNIAEGTEIEFNFRLAIFE